MPASPSSWQRPRRPPNRGGWSCRAPHRPSTSFPVTRPAAPPAFSEAPAEAPNPLPAGPADFSNTSGPAVAEGAAVPHPQQPAPPAGLDLPAAGAELAPTTGSPVDPGANFELQGGYVDSGVGAAVTSDAGTSSTPTDPLDDPAGAPIDTDVMPAETPEPALPQAESAATEAPASGAGGPFVLPADRLPDGQQTTTVNVQVVAPATMNLNKPATGHDPGQEHRRVRRPRGCRPRPVPDGVKFVEASPAPVGPPAGGLLTWNLGDLPAGDQRRLDVTIEPTAIGNHDHAATVALLTGSRGRTLVQQPKLRVEQRSSREPGPARAAGAVRHHRDQHRQRPRPQRADPGRAQRGTGARYRGAAPGAGPGRAGPEQGRARAERVGHAAAADRRIPSAAESRSAPSMP